MVPYKKNDLWNSQSQGQLLITSEAAVQVILNGKKMKPKCKV